MRKHLLLALSLTAALMTLILPVSATNKIEFRANGKDLYYPNPDNDPDPSAVVVGGNWNIRVKDGEADFKLFYKEMNLIPAEEGGAPAGSVDNFYISLVETYELSIQDDACIVYGRFNVDKWAWRPEGSIPPKEHIYNFFGYQDGSIHISPQGLDFQAGPWHLVGSTTSIHNK